MNNLQHPPNDPPFTLTPQNHQNGTTPEAEPVTDLPEDPHSVALPLLSFPGVLISFHI
jgi:hypothetical protein